jgi:quinoprotein glucose dehydrogenase
VRVCPKAARELVGSAAFDFYGAERLGQNLFANCVIALDIRTGKRIWHYQIVLHDLWDRDVPAQPNLITVMHGGKRIDAVAQITKHGYVFVLDRETGEPLFPVEERPVPQSVVGEDKAWPTQPIQLKPPPFTRTELSEAGLSDILPGIRVYMPSVLAATNILGGRGRYMGTAPARLCCCRVCSSLT